MSIQQRNDTNICIWFQKNHSRKFIATRLFSSSFFFLGRLLQILTLELNIIAASDRPWYRGEKKVNWKEKDKNEGVFLTKQKKNKIKHFNFLIALVVAWRRIKLMIWHYWEADFSFLFYFTWIKLKEFLLVFESRKKK